MDEIGNSDFVVLIDDFHYMPRDVQTEAAKFLKEAVRLGVRICAAAVRHRGDNVVRANPDLPWSRPCGQPELLEVRRA